MPRRASRALILCCLALATGVFASGRPPATDREVVFAAESVAARGRAATTADRRLVHPAPGRVTPTGLCNLTGSWLDSLGNEAAVTQTGDALHATSVTPGTGWATADGRVTGDGAAWMDFNGTNLTASIVAGCTNLRWQNHASWIATQPSANVSTVHVVFMTHFDLGFTGLAREVCEQYFFTHFPRGIALSAELRAKGGAAQYAVTTHPWLVLEYLDGTTQCAYTARNASMIALMEGAIARGDVRWHGQFGGGGVVGRCVRAAPPSALPPRYRSQRGAS